jgi:tetratricopeptide (TPR) repeat protein
LARAIGNPFLVATILNNVAVVAQDQGDRTAARAWFEESLAARRAMRDQRGVALSLVNIATLLMDQREYAEAHARLAESLRVQQQLGSVGGIALVLERFAWVAAAQGLAERALRLAGAAAALRDDIGANLTVDARQMLDRRLAPALLMLDEDASSAATAVGRTMTLAEAMAEALRE